LPALLRHQKERKREKLLLLAERVWGVREGDRDSRIEAGIARTEDFFHSFGVFTRLSNYQIGPEAADTIAERIRKRGVKFGEHGDIGPKEVGEILRMAV
ncbi:MAG: NADH-dependent alcohol dehydrogenase, partial [Candidatus Latescibacterota bacterium]